MAQPLGFWGNVIQQCRRKFSRNQPGRSKPAPGGLSHVWWAILCGAWEEPLRSPVLGDARTQHSSSEAIDNARHAAEAKCIHLAPDQDSDLMTSRARPRSPPLVQRTSVRGRK